MLNLHHRFSAAVLGPLVLSGILGLGCGFLGTEPSPPARPLIASLSMDFVVNHGLESVRVWFTQTDPPGPLGPGEVPAGRSVVTLRTSSGDEEEKLLLSFVCLDQKLSRYQCNTFGVGVPEGTTREDLEPRLAPVSGRLIGLYFNGRIAFVFVTEGNVFDAMRQAERWPGVRYVNLSRIGSVQAIGTVEQMQSTPGDAPGLGVLWIPVLSSGPPIPFDGQVQARAGDTITVTYDGGGASLVQATIVVP